jgi:hypothetical protein
MFNNRRQIFWLLIVCLGLIALIGAVLWRYFSIPYISQPQLDKKLPETSLGMSEEEIRRQLQEIDRLRNSSASSVDASGKRFLSEQDIKRQLQAIDRVRLQTNKQSLSEEEIRKQLEEIDKLRNMRK